MEEVEDYVPSQPPMKLVQPQDRPDQEFDDTQQSHVGNNLKQEPRPGSDVNVDYELLLLERKCARRTHVSTISERKTRIDNHRF
jgi:hypothetical protein